ncbi:MAG TPA: hypothetical protein VF950_07230 [Planctomycetota bacterium]
MSVRCAVVLLLGSCAAPARPAPRPVEARDVRGETRGVLDALEASFYVHWGSVERAPEYRRLGREHVPALREEADANGPRAILALRALERLAPEERFTPAAKAILYAAALGREADFSRWGAISPSGFLPGVYGQELLKLGAESAPYLRPLLRDRRRAPASAEPAGRAQGDRVCDYAWILLATIFDRPLAYHGDPDRRDEQIRQMDLWLDRRR